MGSTETETTSDPNTAPDGGNVAKGIVVGIDGSAPSRSALDWAVDHVDEFGPIHPVYAWEYPLAAWAGAPFGGGVVPPAVEMAEAANEAAAAFVDHLDATRRTPASCVHGDAGSVLCDQAQDASLLVVGTRNRGPVRTALTGSVARHCADHTPVPLIIVPHRDADTPPPSLARVVVGVDGSDSSLDALRWACRMAADGAEIVAVSCWQTPIEGPVPYGMARFDHRAFEAATWTTVNTAVDTVTTDLSLPEGSITRVVAEGDPRLVLEQRSAEAELLVVGQRGRSGLSHLFLGSTTTALIRRPQCPTMVIPS